ncbi:oligosaccharide flippase family protein [Chitinophagaceae bacterium MMS25-I14]
MILVSVKRFFNSELINYYLAKVFPGLANLLFIFIVLKVFKTESYGYYSYVFSYATLFNNFFAGWINQGQLRRANKNSDGQEQNIMLYYGIGVSVTLAVIASAIYFVIVHDILRAVLLLLLTIVISIHFLLLNYFQAKFQAKEYRKTEIFRSAVLLAVMLLFAAVFPLKPWTVVIAVIVVYLSAIMYASRSVTPAGIKVDFRFFKDKFPFMLSVFRFAFPVTLWLTVMNLFPVIDRSILSAHAGMSKVGAYTSLYDIVIRSFSLIYFPITAFIHPRFMSSHNNGVKGEAKQILLNGMKHFMWLFLGVLLVVVLGYTTGLFARFLHEGVSLTLLLSLVTAGSLWQFALLVHKPLEAHGRTMQMFLQILASLAVYAGILFVRQRQAGGVDYETLGVGFMISSIVYCLLSVRSFINFYRKS